MITYNSPLMLALLKQDGPQRQPNAFASAPLPLRPVDRLPKPSYEEIMRSNALIEAMLVRRNPGLGLKTTPTMGQTPQELGIGPSPEWQARSDARLARLQGMGNPRAAQAQAEREAYRRKMQQHSDEYATPESQDEVKEMWRRWHEANS